MSIRVMSLVWDSTVAAPQRFTLLALADHADDSGRCWPSVAVLASKCQTAERTIRRHLTELRAIGVLRVEHRAGASSQYVIDVAALAGQAQPTDPGQSDRTGQSVTPDNLTGPDNLSGVEGPNPGQSDSPTPDKLTGHPGQIVRGTTKEPKEQEQEHASASQKPRARTREAKTTTGYTAAFEAFWTAYGRKGAKRNAYAEWQRAVKRAAPEVIVAGVGPYVAATADDPRFRKDAERWLKGDCWESARPGADPAPDLDAAAATEWLRGEWNAGRVKAITERTGLLYRPPDIPLQITGAAAVEQYLVTAARQWITDNHQAILARLSHRRAS